MNDLLDNDTVRQDAGDVSSTQTWRSLDKATQDTATDILTEYSELILDTLTTSDVLRDLPLFKTVSTIYSLVNIVKAKRFHKKLRVFLDEMRYRNASKDETQAFRDKFGADRNYREQVLEHITEQIDQFDSEYKAKILARLFVSFTQEHLSWREFLDLSFALNRSHIIALERLASQDENTIPPDNLRRPTWKDGIPIQAYLESASLLEASGLAVRPEQPLTGTANIMLTRLGLDMLAFGVKPDGPWKAVLVQELR